MNVLIMNTPEQVNDIAYKLMVDEMKAKENEEFVLGLATGGSPLGIYERFRKERPDCAHVTTVNLDEYIGLADDHEQSYHHFMREQLFDHVTFKAHFLPNGVADDAQAESRRYEEIVRTIGVDLQLLGIGENGHIAFNEPGTPFDAPTHVTTLTESTRRANRRFFDKIEEVPTHAVTMGIGTIMRAKQIVLVASGAHKAEAVRTMIEGEVSTDCPATILQSHPNVWIVIDEEAASLCSADVKKRGGRAASFFLKQPETVKAS